MVQLAGGADDIHFANSLHSVFWHRYRTDIGEACVQLEPCDLLSAVCFRYFVQHQQPGRPLSVADAGKSTLKFFLLIPDMVYWGWSFGAQGDLLLQIIQKMDQHFAKETPETLVDYLYDAIRPQYEVVEIEGDPLAETRRTIEWEPIQTWLNSVADKLNKDPENAEFQIQLWNKYVKTDSENQPYLNKDGVKLLLWDLGILSLSPN